MRTLFRSGSILVIAAFILSACGGGGGGVNPSPTPTPTPTPQTTGTPVPIVPGPDAAADCPSTGSLPTSVARQSFATGFAASTQEAVRRRGVMRAAGSARYVPGLITVTYDAATGSSALDKMAARGALRAVADMQFSSLGTRARALAVDPSQAGSIMAQLRKLKGVRTVERAQYRHVTSITANDPYYIGANGTVAPYFETDLLPGQWDMHIINVAGGWSLFSAPPVVGKPIAVIDTGADVLHPELAGGKIVRTGCFVTYPATQNVQSSGPYVTDTDGHGTNVAGISDEDTNNAFAFAGVGYGSLLYAYRIFPTDPSAGCENSTSAQCSTTNVDEASAISDAVSNGAKVINLSIGAPGPLSTCRDTVEENAVENAISAGVVVVAAAGNETAASLDCPGAYPGVIAVGATGLLGTGTAVTEKVATYSNYVTSGLQSGGGAYLVAPGGDPSGSTDSNFLHWIENIYSSAAYNAANCASTADYFGETNDCRILIAGTSQATPHVAGAAALILAVKPSYTPAQVATALCNGADSISSTKQGCGRLNVAGALTYAMSH